MEGKTVLGLKMTNIPLLQGDGEEEDDIDFFESDPLNDKGLTFSIKQPVIHPDLAPISITSHNIMKITSFEQATPLITSFLSTLPDFQIPPPFEGSLYFVPDHVINEKYSQELDRYAKDTDPNSEFSLDLDDAHVNVLAQISIVKFFKGQNIDFSHFLDESTLNVIDNRIIALIHYCMSKSDDHQVSSYHRIHSISEFIKTPSVAPISILFPDFTLQKISHDLCIDLVSMFPHHPLLPSLVEKFNSIIDPTANELLSLIPEDDGDEDTDFSDSFFESINNVQKKQQPLININVINTFNEIVPNALDINQSSNVISVELQEPPSMVTYKNYINESDLNAQLTPNLFKDWVLSLYPHLKECERLSPFILPTKVSKQQKQLYRKSEEKFQSMPTSLRIDDDDEINLSSENLLQVITYTGSMNDLQTMFGTIFAPSLFPLNYTIAHMIYADPKVPYKPRSFIYPAIIENEYKGHKISDNQTLSEVIESFEKLAKIDAQNDEQSTNEVKIESLQSKRDLPNKDTESPPLTVQLMALSDIEFLMHERSPLTFDHNSSQPPFSKDSEKTTRGQQLFQIYTKYIYPPYLTFRAATALALNVIDTDATLAINFLFEGIYVLLYNYPQMLRVDFVRNVILYLAELLEKQEQYYYSSLFFDVFYLSNQNDMKHSNEIALLCQKNLDSVRTVFHYTQSMKYLVNEAKTEEALYLAQVLASIYNEYSDYESPISILSFLLKDTYDFLSNTHKSTEPPLPNKPGGSIQPRKLTKGNKPPLGKQFKPQADQLNTILTGTSLCEILIKTRHFSHASRLLSSLHASNGNAMSNTLLSFVEKQSLLKKNLFKEFLKSIQDLQFKSRRNTPTVKFSVLSAASFDNPLATVRLLIRGYLKRELFRYSLLWSEAYITAQPKMAMKDIGYGFLTRGLSLYQALHHIHSMSPPYSLYAICSTISNKILSYADDKNKEFKTYEDVFVEALSSLKAAFICLDKVGSQRQLSYSYLLYADLLLMHFFDSEFERLNIKNLNSSSATSLNDNLNENDEDEIGDINTESDCEFELDDNLDDDSKIKPITISEPIMRIKINNFPLLMSKVAYFPPTTISKQNIIDELRKVFRRIDSIVTKCMNPIYIIYYQALLSKYLFLQKKIEGSKKIFDYAFNNMKKYFFNGDEIICKDASLPTISLFRYVVMNMGTTLLFYDKNFINDRLIIFDWLRSIQTLYQHQIRVVTEENKERIEPRLEVSINSLSPMKSLKVVDFLKVLKNAGVESSKSKNSNDTITKCLSCINVNIHLFETGKTSEEEMHLNNEELCKQIESIADEYRRASKLNMPIDMTYSYVSKMFPMVQGVIYLQHLNDSIFLYRPSNGLKRRILLKSIAHSETEKPEKSNINLSSNLNPSNSSSNTINSNPGIRTQSTNSISSIASSSSISSISSDILNYSNSAVFKGSTISTMTNKGEITYNSTSSLFQPKFIEMVALFLMCDKKQRHDQFNSRLARKLCSETNDTIFGSSLDDLTVWEKIADKHFFGENRIFGKGLKGAFCSVKTSMPSIFITSLDLNALPLELMLPNILLIRVRSYARFISKPVDFKPENQGKYPRIKICRIKQNPYHMMKVAIRRSKDTTSEFISAIGGDIPQLQNVFENDRSFFYPFSLFSSNNSNLYYTDKFAFCDIIELSSESTIDLNINTIINSYQNTNNNNNNNSSNNSENETNNKNDKETKNASNTTSVQSKVSIFVFTYSDLGEMPLLLEKLIDSFPLSYFMFIPAQFVREAFQQMVMIFERHQRRIKFVEDHPDDASLSLHKDICNSTFDFVTLLQATLIQFLDCPIPLYVPPQ